MLRDEPPAVTRSRHPCGRVLTARPYAEVWLWLGQHGVQGLVADVTNRKPPQTASSRRHMKG
jgi:hypothetical protein